jgi:hypothetical protein
MGCRKRTTVCSVWINPRRRGTRSADAVPALTIMNRMGDDREVLREGRYGMERFEDLPLNARALILAKLAVEMKAQNARTLRHLAQIRRTDVNELWRNICRSAGQRPCTLPAQAI